METKKFSRPLDLRQVQITDGFWGREQELVRREVIPYQWEALNDRVEGAAPSYCMRNFKVAGALMQKKRREGNAFVPPAYTFRGFEVLPEEGMEPEPDRFYGFVFQDSDFSKWIEAVAYSLTVHPDPALERIADEAIEIVCAAQAENGYLDTYYIINGMDRIFTNLRDHHELYCFGHLAEGAAAYYQATGKDRLLNAARRYADFIAERFGPEEGQCKGYPGHEIAEMALVRLYEVTGEKRYLELASFFLEMRGQRPYYFDQEEKERAAYEGRPWKEPGEGQRYVYHQAHQPVREQTEAVGHAVRAVYLYSGMADIARLRGDESLYAACKRLWESITGQKLYVTGGIGATHLGEAFSFPYDLPNDTAYSETCAAIGLAFFARRMLEIEADSGYGDVMEQALYNTVLAGMALDGRSFFYVNPLEVVPEAAKRDERKHHIKTRRQKWFGCACCPPNIARIVSSLGKYVYTLGEQILYTHLYVGSSARFELGGTTIGLRMESDFPWEGNVKVTVDAEEAAFGTLAFRLPGWCRKAVFRVQEGENILAAGEIAPGAGDGSLGTGAVQVRLEKGYLYLTGQWRDGAQISLTFPMEVRLLAADANVREDVGKAAVSRGPLCYCLEEADNGKDLHLLKLCADKLLTAQGAVEPQAVSVESFSIQGQKMCRLILPGLRLLPPKGRGLYSDYVPPAMEETKLVFVPYYAWNNRGEGEMQVWTAL